MVTRLISSEERRFRPPTHPGAILKADVLPALGITQERFAEDLRLSRKTVNGMLGGSAPVTVETAIRLGGLLGNSPLFWLNLQAAHDLWQAQAVLPAVEMKRLEDLHLQYVQADKL